MNRQSDLDLLIIREGDALGLMGQIYEGLYEEGAAVNAVVVSLATLGGL